ncbi:MAG: hypothetical protein ACJ742_13040 [Actinomycetes bacterium]
MVVEAVQQEGVGAGQLAQGRDLGRVGRPDLAGRSVSGGARAPSRRASSTAGSWGWTTTQRRRVRHRSSFMAEP